MFEATYPSQLFQKFQEQFAIPKTRYLDFFEWLTIQNEKVRVSKKRVQISKITFDSLEKSRNRNLRNAKPR